MTVDFVVHKHNAKRAGLHYDLRIQTTPKSKKMYSFAIKKGIPKEPGQKFLAVRQPLHDIWWKDFEGSLPEGEYGEGTLEIWDSGKADLLKDNGLVKVYDFHGHKMKGLYSLVYLSGENFLIVKNKPKYRD